MTTTTIEPQVEQTAVVTEAEPVAAEPGTETILLVEDEQMVRKLARHILEMSGYTVVEARNGKEAIECCKSLTRPPGLLLTDVVMPEMSGPALVEEMMKVFPDIGVLYMSGYNDRLGSYGITTEGSSFLQKPFSPDGLATKVREVLDSER
jgi:two-component system cell cycle sensor histidine kinase/response regulator CckA